MTNHARNTKRPSLFWLVTEPGRALTEWGLNISLQKIAPARANGDGHPVMVLPGFMTSHTSTKPLRDYIAQLGYEVFDWGLGRNLGKVEYMELLLESLDEIYQLRQREISLVGWSLGGVFARQLAKERPDIIRQVITLGSPFAGLTEPNNVEWIYTLISGGRKAGNTNHYLLENLPLPAPLPTTAVFSREDGVVAWQTCMEQAPGPLHQNIQVRGSHLGLGVNPGVWAVIADRLQYDKHNWKPFEAKGILQQLWLD